jgi:hypothetical protein
VNVTGLVDAERLVAIVAGEGRNSWNLDNGVCRSVTRKSNVAVDVDVAVDIRNCRRRPRLSWIGIVLSAAAKVMESAPATLFAAQTASRKAHETFAPGKVAKVINAQLPPDASRISAA